jgi:hypothetical protein
LSELKEILDKLGRAKQEIQHPQGKIVADVANRIIAKLQENLKKYIPKANRISQDITFEPIEITAQGVKLNITAQDYWKFVEEGVNGLQVNFGSPYSFRTPRPNRAMAASIAQWMGERSISDSGNFQGASWAIATAKKRDGIRPKPFVSDTLTPTFIEEISTHISNELGKTVTLAVK